MLLLLAPWVQVAPLLPDNRPATPELSNGIWQLQEFSLRGESFG